MAIINMISVYIYTWLIFERFLAEWRMLAAAQAAILVISWVL